MEILPDDVKPLLTAKEAARYLRIESEKKLYDKLKQDDFPAFKDEGRWLIASKNLDEYLVNKRDKLSLKKSA